ncbi:hypothetical protein J6590_085892 [Homalodisca vitripennis]|nr:hypothetical protein J6590_085892 [Homalodisca vitripennis]
MIRLLNMTGPNSDQALPGNQATRTHDQMCKQLTAPYRPSVTGEPSYKKPRPNV